MDGVKTPPLPKGGPPKGHPRSSNNSIWSGTRLCKKSYGCRRILNIQEYFYSTRRQIPTIYCKDCWNTKI